MKPERLSSWISYDHSAWMCMAGVNCKWSCKPGRILQSMLLTTIQSPKLHKTIQTLTLCQCNPKHWLRNLFWWFKNLFVRPPLVLSRCCCCWTCCCYFCCCFCCMYLLRSYRGGTSRPSTSTWSNTYSRSSSRSSSSRSSSSSIWIRPEGTSQEDFLITSKKDFLINVLGYYHFGLPKRSIRNSEQTFCTFRNELSLWIGTAGLYEY